MNQDLREKAREYSRKWEWNMKELSEAVRVHKQLSFSTLEDLDFEVLDFFYDRMLSRIMGDAKALVKQRNYNYAYEWGKAYLNHYAGWYALVSKMEHPAIHTCNAYDMVQDKLIESCEAGAEEDEPDGDIM